MVQRKCLMCALDLENKTKYFRKCKGIINCHKTFDYYCENCYYNMYIERFNKKRKNTKNDI